MHWWICTTWLLHAGKEGSFHMGKYYHFNNKVSKAQRYTPIVPGLGRLRHVDIEFKALLGCITRLCLSKQDKTKVTLLRWGLPLSFYFTVSLLILHIYHKPFDPLQLLCFPSSDFYLLWAPCLSLCPRACLKVKLAAWGSWRLSHTPHSGPGDSVDQRQGHLLCASVPQMFWPGLICIVFHWGLPRVIWVGRVGMFVL